MIALSVSEIEGGPLSVTEKEQKDWSWSILVLGFALRCAILQLHGASGPCSIIYNLWIGLNRAEPCCRRREGSESLKKFEVSAQSQETLYLTFPKIARDLASSESKKKSQNRKHSALEIEIFIILYFVLCPFSKYM